MTKGNGANPFAQLGYAVYLRRGRLGVSQAQLAKRAGMHRNYVGAIERGEINPTYDTLLRLTAGLGVPLHLLIKEASGTDQVVPVTHRRRPAASDRTA